MRPGSGGYDSRNPSADRGSAVRESKAQLLSTGKSPLPTVQKTFWFAVAIGACLAGSYVFAGACDMQQYLELPVTMMGLYPTVDAKINGTDVRLKIDSGAYYSSISTASAAELKLPTTPRPPGLAMVGVGGIVYPSIAHAETLALGGATMHDVEFLTGGSESSGEAGLLGRNILAVQDAEYDLNHGVVRLMRTQNCEHAQLAYWAGAADSYSVIDLIAPRIRGYLLDTRKRGPDFAYQWSAPAFVNGRQITVIFDSGAGVSALSLDAAMSIGIRPDSPGVVAAGATSGIGSGEVKTYLAPISSFKIGEEEIRNTRLYVVAIPSFGAAEMLIGADFFLSHRIFIANNEHKVFFSYNGGPVFNLTGTKQAVSASGPPSSSAQSSPGVAEQPEALAIADNSARQSVRTPGADGDAADHARRGAALAARREFAGAINSVKLAHWLPRMRATSFSEALFTTSSTRLRWLERISTERSR
jgi:predicted aspartyl protease